MRATRRLRRLARRLGGAAARFRERSDVLQQAAWAKEARAVRAEIDAMPGEMLSSSERRAAVEILLAMNAVAANATGQATKEEADGHLAAARRLLKGKGDVEA